MTTERLYEATRKLYEAAAAVVDEGMEDERDGYVLVPQDKFNQLVMAVPASFERMS